MNSNIRRGVRAAEGSGLENQRAERPRGFESHPLRHISFSDPEYAARHKSVVREIQIQKDCNEKAAQSDMFMTITSNFDVSL